MTRECLRDPIVSYACLRESQLRGRRDPPFSASNRDMPNMGATIRMYRASYYRTVAKIGVGLEAQQRTAG